MKRHKQFATAGVALTIVGTLAGCATDNRSALTNYSVSANIEQSVQQSNDTTTANTSNTSHPVNNNLMIEKDAKIKLLTKADLFNDGQSETIALVNLPLVNGQDYSGYLGIWDAKGHLLQKFPLHGYNIMFPIRIYMKDLTQDGNPDILLETDEHSNGGNGVHHVYIYIQRDHHFVETPLPDSPVTALIAKYQNTKQSFLIQSQKDPSRSWSVKLNVDLMKYLDRKLLSGKQVVQIDPVSSTQVTSGSIATKRWLWFGNLQLNNLGFLVTHYQYSDGKWKVVQYDVESSGSAQVSQN